jgi:long-subunit fatty acid transport protein
VVTPTWYDVDETSSSAKVINVDETKGIELGTNPDRNILNRLVSIGYKVAQRNNIYYITSIPRLSTVTYEDNYQLRTPFKANGGVALFFKKKGFVSADIEYVAYKGMNVSTTNPDSEIAGDLENSTANINLFYNNVLNVKIGGEYRVGNVSLRGGFNYMPTPYSTNFDNSNTIDRSQKIYSAGLGYRTNEFYIDVTGMYGTTQQSFTPYSLTSSGDYASAKIDNSYVKGLVSFGIFF